MKQYYLRSIVLGNIVSMNNLGDYYWEIENNFCLAKKYYLYAFNHGSDEGAYNLSLYYSKKKKRKQILFYVKKSAELGHSKGIKFMCDYYMTKLPKKKYFLFGLKHERADLIIRHYQPKYNRYLYQVSKAALSKNLIAIRQELINSIFAWYQKKDTWFKHYCVKDVVGMIQDYLLQ